MTTTELLKSLVQGATVTAEMETAAKALLEKAHAKAVAKADKAKEKREKEDAPLLKSLVEYMGVHGDTLASDIAAVLEVSTSKATALAKSLVTSGKATVTDVKVKGKGTCKCYKLTE